MCPECIKMHVDRANEVAMAAKPTDPAYPISAVGLVFMTTYRTPTTGSSFGAGEAHDVGSFRFVDKIFDILAIFPERHTLIVMPTVISIAHPMRVANEERTDFVFNTEVDHLAGGLVPMVTNTPFHPSALFVLGTLELLPSMRILLAPGLLLGNLSQAPVAVSLESADTPSGDDQGFACSGGDSSQVDFAKVYGRLTLTWGVLSLWNFYAHMQLKASVPNQCTGPALLWQIKRQYQRGTTFAHWQDRPSFFFAHGLSRPLDRVEAFCTPGILHLHLWMLFAQFARGSDVAEECAGDLLDSLRIQSKAAFGEVMQFSGSRPLAMSLASLLVCLHAEVPDLGRFHLSSFRYEELASRQQMVQPVDNDCLQAWLPFCCFLTYSAMAVKISPFSERLCCLATSRICSNSGAEIRTVTVLMLSFMQLFYHHYNCISSRWALSSLPLNGEGTPAPFL